MSIDKENNLKLSFLQHAKVKLKKTLFKNVTVNFLYLYSQKNKKKERVRF